MAGGDRPAVRGRDLAAPGARPRPRRPRGAACRWPAAGSTSPTCSTRPRCGGQPTFVVGPPPTLGPVFNARVAELSDAFADVAQRRRVTFVDTFGPLEHHDQWHADLAGGDGIHPAQAGYGLMAWLVLHGGWHRWLGLPGE